MVPALSRRAGVGLERANSAFQGAVRLSTLVGPPLGGVLIAALGTSEVLLVDAATFLVSAAAVALFVSPAARTAEGAGDRESGGYLTELAEGLRFFGRTRVVFGIVIDGVAVNFFAEPVYVVVLPVYAQEVFASAPAFGLLLGGFGAGALAGTALFGALGSRLPRRATLVAALTLSAVPFAALAAAPPLAVGVGLMALQGLGVGAINPLVFTVIRSAPPSGCWGGSSGRSLRWRRGRRRWGSCWPASRWRAWAWAPCCWPSRRGSSASFSTRSWTPRSVRWRSPPRRAKIRTGKNPRSRDHDAGDRRRPRNSVAGLTALPPSIFRP